MRQMMNYPVLIGVITLAGLWVFAQLGAFVRARKRQEDDSDHGEYGMVLSATLTLLGLLIGFSFSMAIGRYDQRKNYEEEEANAIGTEYVRADLLPESSRSKVQAQLVQYLDLRIKRYDAHASHDITELAANTGRLQVDMWREVQAAALANPTPVMATVVTGMNDVLNRQGYTQAARLNRIPLPAWGLMASIALFSNFLIGYGAKRRHSVMFLIVPLAIAVSFLLIADIDSPQGGLIRVEPQNLTTLADSLKAE
jgi:hypothetical protein